MYHLKALDIMLAHCKIALLSLTRQLIHGSPAIYKLQPGLIHAIYLFHLEAMNLVYNSGLSIICWQVVKHLSYPQQGEWLSCLISYNQILVYQMANIKAGPYLLQCELRWIMMPHQNHTMILVNFERV